MLPGCTRSTQAGPVTTSSSSLQGGNGDPYDGGDLAKQGVTAALGDTKKALALIASGYDTASLGESKNFLTTNIAGLSAKAATVTVEISDTANKGDGVVRFSRADALTLSRASRIAVIVREVALLNDSQIARGDQMLDTAAIAVGAYYVAHPVGAGAPDVEFNAGGVVMRAAYAKTYAETVLGDGPTGYWRLDDGAGSVVKDYGPGRRDGFRFKAETGVPGALAGGMADTAVRTNGVDAYLSFTNFGQTASAPFTVEYWCNVTNAERVGRQACGAMTHRTDVAQGYAIFFDGTNRFYFQTGNGVTWPGVSISTQIAGNGWYHIVAVYDGASHSLYINGQLAGNDTRGVGYASSGQAMWLNRNTNPPEQGQYYTGAIDELAFYPYGLNRDQILEHYRGASAPVPGSSGTPVHLVQPDGKILVGVPVTSNGLNQLVLSRYQVDGSPDASFNGNGQLFTSIRSKSTVPFAPVFALAADGKVVVAGPAARNPFLLARYNADGTPDASFSTDGRSPLSNDPVVGYPTAIAIAGDGKILVAGKSYGSGTQPSRVTVTRYTTAGARDANFSRALSTGNEWATTLAMLPNGKVFVGGQTEATDTKSSMLLVRLDAALALDTSFDGNGWIAADWGTLFNDVIASAVQSDGKIVIAGNARDGGLSRFGLARFDANGGLDGRFGTAGKVITMIGKEAATLSSMVLTSDGKVVVAGTALMNASPIPTVARYTQDGVRDGDALVGDDLATGLRDLNGWSIGSLSTAGGGKIHLSGKYDVGGKPGVFLMRLWY